MHSYFRNVDASISAIDLPREGNLAPFFFLTPYPFCWSSNQMLFTHCLCVGRALLNCYQMILIIFKQPCPLIIAAYAQHMGMNKRLYLQLPAVMCGWTACTPKSMKHCLLHSHVQRCWKKNCVGDKNFPSFTYRVGEG